MKENFVEQIKWVKKLGKHFNKINSMVGKFFLNDKRRITGLSGQGARPRNTARGNKAEGTGNVTDQQPTVELKSNT
jgi:hypothetical protein